MITLEASDEEVLREMRRIRELYRLKSTMRYESVRDTSVHSESVAEHLFGMLILAEYFYPHEDPEGALDRARVTQLILYHDVGEALTGDVIFSKKREGHEARERAAVREIAQRAPAAIRPHILDRFREYDSLASREAAYAYAIDKIEPIFELLDNSMFSYVQHGITFEVATKRKREATERFPYMRRFLDAWASYAIKENVFAE